MSTRGEVRAGWAGVLADALSDDVEEVHSHFAKDIAGKTPVVVVASAGSDRERMTADGSGPRFFVDVYLFVLRGEPGSVAYTEADADDMLDTLEAAVAAAVDAQQVTEHWQAVSYVEASRIDAVMLPGNRQYWVERIPLVFDSF